MVHNKSVKGVNFTFIWILLGTMSGCSVFDQNYMMRVATPPEYEELNKYVEELKHTKPEVERLSSLVQDLALVIEDAGKLPAFKLAPSQHVKPEVMEPVQVENNKLNATDSVSKNITMPPEVTNVDSNRQTYAAHLGFFLKKDSAHAGWNTLKHRYPLILNNLTPVIKKVVRKQQIIYSLRVGPFDKEVGAKEVCYVFSYYKYQCLLTDFSGDAILI